jgi:AMMECR1 domain-containing protein
MVVAYLARAPSARARDQDVPHPGQARAAVTERAGLFPQRASEMKQHAEKFLDEWVEKYDLIQGCSGRDQTEIERLADTLSPTLRPKASVKPI